MLKLVFTPPKREEPLEWIEGTLSVGLLLVELIKPSFVVCWMFFYEVYALLVAVPIRLFAVIIYVNACSLCQRRESGREVALNITYIEIFDH